MALSARKSPFSARRRSTHRTESKKSEHSQQAVFFSILRETAHPAAAVTFAVPNGFLRTKSMRIRAWQEGVMAGVWDVFCAYPTKSAVGLWLEFKVGKNDLTKEQREFGERVKAQGYALAVVRSWNEALDVWAEYLDLEVRLK